MTTLDQLLNTPTGRDTLDDAMAILENAIRNQPRSLQKRIGPSELGTDCIHCLAAKLAEWPTIEQAVPWTPFIGTAIHAEIANIFNTETKTLLRSGTPPRWRVEEKVYVGMVGPHTITGTCDLYDETNGTVLDWKNTATSTITNAKAHGPKPVYRTQVHLYGLGWEHSGKPVRNVAIAYLPRTSTRLRDAYLWTEPYDRDIALETLDRANRLYTNLTTLASISTETRDEWISRQPRADRCFDCQKFHDWTPTSRLATELGYPTTTTRKAT